jgi:L,D-peptidoglycan transpeptidase YkuD (ErfK/YbiS/YcfS/YnhG family)
MHLGRQTAKAPTLKFLASSDGWVNFNGQRARCALGPAGVIPAPDKREGDGKTPLGAWPLRRVLYRPDRGGPPATALPVQALEPDDGWCDAPEDPHYNQPVKLPYRASAERLWLKEHVYDLIVVLGHNDDPPVPGLGSAIFLHMAWPDYRPTQGCVALARPDLEAFLAVARPGDALEIVA